MLITDPLERRAKSRRNVEYHFGFAQYPASSLTYVRLSKLYYAVFLVI